MTGFSNMIRVIYEAEAEAEAEEQHQIHDTFQLIKILCQQIFL